MSRIANRSAASRKAWATRKARALTRSRGATPPPPRADAGHSVAEILARLRAAGRVTR